MGRIRDAIAGVFHEIGYSLSTARPSKPSEKVSSGECEQRFTLAEAPSSAGSYSNNSSPATNRTTLGSQTEQRSSTGSDFGQGRYKNVQDHVMSGFNRHSQRRDSLDPTVLSQIRHTSSIPPAFHTARPLTHGTKSLNRSRQKEKASNSRQINQGSLEQGTKDAGYSIGSSKLETSESAHQQQMYRRSHPFELSKIHSIVNNDGSPMPIVSSETNQHHQKNGTDRTDTYRRHEAKPKQSIASTFQSQSIPRQSAPFFKRTISADQVALHSKPIFDSSSEVLRKESSRHRNRSRSIDPQESSSRIGHEEVKWNDRGNSVGRKDPSEASELSMLTDLNQPEYQSIIRDGESRTMKNIRALHDQRMKQRAQKLQHKEDLKQFNKSFKEHDDWREQEQRTRAPRTASAAAPPGVRRPYPGELRSCARELNEGVAHTSDGGEPFEPRDTLELSPVMHTAAHYMYDMSPESTELSTIPFKGTQSAD